MTVLTDSTANRNTDAPPIPLERLIKVELRKLVDTRAGFWLTASIALIAAIVMVVMLISARNHPEDLSFSAFFGSMNIPTGIILPIMAILLVTSEWSQRNGLTTFTMEPRRDRIILAKLGASLIAVVGAVLVALLLGAVGTAVAGLIYGDPAGSWSFTGANLVNSLVLQVFGVLLGFGFAALILNTPGAIVAYFALPSALSLLAGLVPAFGDHIGEWIDTARTNEAFMSSEWASPGEWARLLVSGAIWIGIPLGLGILRILRAEVK
ncbi:ABC transporter permease [Gordonia caeni]|uniref:ABC transporter permease n=1 Tax=Gordonia caeni TaxID=1007097 RepID=A0ABP7P102_9ACTN